MNTLTLIGLSFILGGAICGGSFGLPSKFARKETPWEVLWGVFFFIATIVIPVLVFPLIVDGLWETCGKASFSALAGPVIFGFLWGLGSMSLGMSFSFIGLSLAYAINYGAQITFGYLIPMSLHNPQDLLTSEGIIILFGIMICLAGVVVTGLAGVMRNRTQQAAAAVDAAKPAAPAQIGKGLLFAFISGFLCACYAVAFSYGDSVMKLSQEGYGNPAWRSTFVVTALVLWGGAVSSCLYCVFKLIKNGTWKQLFCMNIMGRVVFIALIMAVLHDSAILLWGLGASKLGPLGVAVGYAIFMSFAIIVGNINGFLTKEWVGACRKSIVLMLAGIFILIAGVCTMSYGNAAKLDNQEAAAKPSSSQAPAAPAPDSRKPN